MPTLMSPRIASFVVLDLEASTYDGNESKLSVAELCMYGFPSTDLKTQPIRVTPNSKICSPLPSPNLNKLTLLCNPQKVIYPTTTAMSKLDNYMLEYESCFDANTAVIITSFIKHMPQPVCLVAHGGSKHDFAIVKNTFNKLKLELPHDILCIDSVNVFWGIDKLKECDPEFINKHNGQYPPRGTYKLKNMYERFFKEAPKVMHQAEADVESLTHLMNVYGSDFLLYAQNHAIPFKDVGSNV
ncbi:three-prime repair exonuclease 1 [Zeugodacus cucurbitae]|uniref:three-prime repair exonuclease 1 n=1 Tax=Zeugodacus cucurbitae TaxID=28588 RepID=UPI0005968098|nr:three-prime repair exonuclease 1 [Zeugodacus cucurbitae]